MNRLPSLLSTVVCLSIPASRSEAQLPPELVSVSQSASQVRPEGSALFGAVASDPQGSPLTFTWSASAGWLGTPTQGADTSEVSWSPPLCLASGSAPVSVTATNALGLSATASFAIDVQRDLGEDRQRDFHPMELSLDDNVMLTADSPPKLRLNHNLTPLSMERIMFPTARQLSVSFVSEQSEASHSLGWLYYDDLVSLGYIDTRYTPWDSSDDVLRDANANGIADLHEDLYNLAPPSGPQARPYIGNARRCSQRTFVSGGFQYSQPELALNSICNNAFAPAQSLADARPGRSHLFHTVDVVGAFSTTTPGTGFSDGGLYPRIPNLLEPAAAANGFKGVGRLSFLLADDDDDMTVFNRLAPVTDASYLWDGIPDYDVSAYDGTGLLRATNPDPGISDLDRTVDLGWVEAYREIVFFLVVQNSIPHDPEYGEVYPCLRKAADGRCTLHLKTSTSVFFSKSRWNLDPDVIGTQVPQRNMGCGFNPGCNPAAPGAYSCTLNGSTQRRCGWLEPMTLGQLGSPDHGQLVLPKEATAAPVPVSGGTPHLMLGAPSTAHGQWILGFEDVSGGGDRDFNDVVFRLQATASGGTVRSSSLNAESPYVADLCHVSRVRFRALDFAMEYVPSACGTPASPLITYFVASDCRVCLQDVCTVNPTPTWVQVPLTAGQNEAVVDLTSHQGSQLCWRADLRSPSEFCAPTILDVDIGYALTPAP
ncbi:DUF4114 domain-containing protein [Pyxidicoccus xibeiensis]|uniref:DUF4114 domain-containing protein n=1 Tax=Pyxidicoccus xibeiensis TaxID=2906759 RepID=UPI0020A7545D|nr:DUF4114 domain-containing protein [Pyxidicoccus xibeiensis]MCP3138434.1 DUF4114 domain-containing protein [Pyxidicoccus xibeiensis]